MTCLQKDTTLVKSAERVLSETYIFNIKKNDVHFIFVQNLFFLKDIVEILSISPSIFLGHHAL